MIRCVVGLGNPGEQYAATRHNIGFRIVDTVARTHNARWRKGWWRSYWQAELSTPALLLCKPATFMNRSGDAVIEVCRKYMLDAQELLVVYDDVDLPLGRLRARRSGSAGGHNGMRSIIARLGTEEVPRLRVGIGAAADDRVEHVLSAFTPDEQPLADAAVAAGAQAALMLATLPWERAQQRINSWRPGTVLDAGFDPSVNCTVTTLTA